MLVMSSRVARAMCLLCLTALAMSVYLSAASLTGGSIPGCDGQQGWGCGQLLQGRFASWFGLPVSLLGTVAYAALLFCLGLAGSRSSSHPRRLVGSLIVLLCLLCAGAAIWFIGLQLVYERQICPYCMIVHACGLTLGVLCLAAIDRSAQPQPASRRSRRHTSDSSAEVLSLQRAAGLAGLGLGGLILGQLLIEPARYRMDYLPEPKEGVERASTSDGRGPGTEKTEAVGRKGDQAANPPPSQIPAPPPNADDDPDQASREESDRGDSTDRRGSPPPISRQPDTELAAGRVRFHRDDVPLLGEPSAPRVIASIFDYSCPVCRTMHQRLSEAEARYRGQLVIAAIPVPMHPDCNRYVTVRDEQHRDSCEYSRLALAVWKVNPAAFAAFHDELFAGEAPPSREAARQFAGDLVGPEELEAALDDPELDKLIDRNVSFYDRLDRGSVPKLLVPAGALNGAPSTSQLFGFLEQQLGVTHE